MFTVIGEVKNNAGLDCANLTCAIWPFYQLENKKCVNNGHEN